MANEITLSKGGITVTVHTEEVNDNFGSKIFIITPAQSSSNQADGPKDAKVVDLLRVTHTIVIKGNLVGTATKTAVQIKQDLVNIFKGGGAVGGTVTMTYDSNAKAFGNTGTTANTSIGGYIEKLNFKEKSMDLPPDFASSKENYQDVAQFEVIITFLEGIKVS